MKKFLLHVGRITICLLVAVVCYGQAQQETMLDTSHGLSDNQVSDVHKDKLGYLWVATEHGLNRYDGIDFKVFRYDPKDTNSIRANSLERLYEDHQSNIWVTLSIGGVSRYDRKTDRFEYYTYDPKNRNNPNNFINHVLVDSKGEVWIATKTHINKLDKITGMYKPVSVSGFEKTDVFKSYQDSDQNIWIGTDQGLFRYSYQNQQFEEVRDKAGNKLEEIFRFQEDGNGTLWFSSYYHVYQLRAGKPIKVQRPNDRFITNLFTSKEGKVLISQYDDHIYAWHDGEWNTLAAQTNTANPLSWGYANNLMSHILLEDSEGNLTIYDEESQTSMSLTTSVKEIRSFWFGPDSRELWLGTSEKGLVKVDLKPRYLHQQLLNPVNPEYAEANYTGAMTPLTDGQVLIASGGVLHRYNTQLQKSSPLNSPDIADLMREGISAMEAYDPEHVLIASVNGVSRLNLQTKKVQGKPLLAKGRTYDMLIDKDTLWAIGQYGLAFYDLLSENVTYFQDLADTPLTLTGSGVRSIYKDANSTTWVGAVREGLFRVAYDKDEKRFQAKSYQYSGARTGTFKSHTVNQLLEDKSGRLLVAGFSSGLLEFDWNAEQFINHNPEGQLPIPNIQTLEEAPDGSIWMSALDGIHRYDPETGSFQKLSMEDGWNNSHFTLRTSAKSSSGQLFFGTQAGITFINPTDFRQMPAIRETRIEAFTVHTDGTTFRQPESTIPVSLGYQQRFVSFQFISLDYHSPEKTIYQYKLEGLEKDWNTGKNRQVQYANLTPGDYTFKVRASTDGGNWGENYATLSFTIAYPFWQALWFQALVLLSVAGLIYAIYRFRLNNRRSKARVLENIRQSAAADFHDEMGNKLTRIALFSEVLEQKLNGSSSEISSYVSKIKDNSHVLNSSMRDFLWALDPAKDTAFDLIILLKDFGDELFDNSGINFHGAAIKETLKSYPLSMDWKRHLVMIFKEAMHNALKYSMARNVTLKASLSRDVLNLSLTDDGQGFDPMEIDNGYGQANMKRRADQLGASVSIESKPGKGTIVTFVGTLSKKYETYD
jgi:ligand-binding sensor domain-containing protein/signal transduction histidine kinase